MHHPEDASLVLETSSGSGRKLYWRCLVAVLLVCGSGCMADRDLAEGGVCPPNNKNSPCRCSLVTNNNASLVTCCNIESKYSSKEGLSCIDTTRLVNTSLFIKNFHLDDLDLSHSLFSNVQHLSVSNSSIAHLSGKIISKTLLTVNLSSLGLVNISDTAFVNVSNLVSLDLSNNNLTAVPMIPNKLKLLDLWNNSHLICDTVKDIIKKQPQLEILRNKTTFCSLQRSFHWFNATNILSLDQLDVTKIAVEGCPRGADYSCNCEVSHLVLVAGKPSVHSIKVDCSNLGLTALPPDVPENTFQLNVTNNFIVSLDPLVHNKNYLNLREFFADNNRIESISVLEGTQFIVNFMKLSLRRNRLKNIPTYFLSSTFDRNTYPRVVMLGDNHLECNCTTATTLKTFLRTHEIHIPDSGEVYCEKDNTKVIMLQPEIMCVSYIPKKWTDYIYYIIAGEVFLLVALVSKVSYDYWVFKSTGSLPWPASRMPKLPCDWVFE